MKNTLHVIIIAAIAAVIAVAAALIGYNVGHSAASAEFASSTVYILDEATGDVYAGGFERGGFEFGTFGPAVHIDTSCTR